MGGGLGWGRWRKGGTSGGVGGRVVVEMENEI